MNQRRRCDVITVDVREGDDLENGDDDERKAGAVPVKQVHDVDAILKAASPVDTSSQSHVITITRHHNHTSSQLHPNISSFPESPPTSPLPP